MQIAAQQINSIPSAKCRHCNSTVLNQSDTFCCPGCEFVHRSIQALGLASFYEILSKSDSSLKPAQVKPQKFDYCNDPLFIESFTRLITGGQREINFFLDGLHCAACIWILEKLPEVENGLLSARLNFATAELTLNYNPGLTNPARLASLINSLGYKPTPLKGSAGEKVRRAAKRIFLARIGVAAVCSMNIMMLAVSLYQGDFTGIPGSYRNLFSWVSLVLTLPVVFFSAIPFYRTALGGLRSGVLHIDLPICLAILAGFGLSAWNTFSGGPNIYYDSISALVFLLLTGRWIQSRSLERATNAHSLIYAISPRVARQDGVEIFVDSIALESEVEVRTGETIPVDGLVCRGSGMINNSFLTGEPENIRAVQGDLVFAGSRLEDGQIDVQVKATGRDTRLGAIMQTVESASKHRAPLESFLDRVSRNFTALVLMLSFFTFSYWLQYDARLAIEHAIALLIIACPCVIAFATPLTFSLAISDAAKLGILFRSAEAIERLTKIKNVVFDKTGTLTKGQIQVQAIFVKCKELVEFKRISVSQFSILEPELATIILALEAGISHPVAEGLRKICQSNSKLPTLSELEIIPGLGLRAVISGLTWSIESLRQEAENFPNQELSWLGLKCGPDLVAAFGVGDELRAEAPEVISRLKNEGKCCYLLSGDRNSVVERTATQLGLPKGQSMGQASPEDKLNFIRQLQRTSPTTMIGDGINDAAAFQAASVGIGFHGGAEAALKVADVYLAEQNLHSVLDIFEGSECCLRTIKRNLIISATYNSIGAVCAMLGLIGPLAAAILMPLSSITVITNSMLSKSFRK